MRLSNSSFFSLLLLPITLAAPIDTTAASSSSDTSAAVQNIYEVVTQRVNFELTALVRDLESMVHSRPADRTNLASVITAQSARVVSTSRDGAATMRSAHPPTLFQEGELVGPVSRLTMLTRDSERHWFAIRDIVFAMNGQQKVIQILKDTNQAAAEFSYAMNGKMTGLAKEVGKVYGDAVDVMVKDVIKAYESPRSGSVVGWS